MKKTHVLSLVLFVLSAVVSFDLLVNFLRNLIPNVNDGITTYGLISRLIFGDRLWSIEKFFNTFVISGLITLFVCIENVILHIFCAKKE